MVISPKILPWYWGTILVDEDWSWLVPRIEQGGRLSGNFEVGPFRRKRIPVPADIRFLVIQRANNICQRCGKAEVHDIHHADGDATNNELQNLEALCVRCHRKTYPGRGQ